MVFVGGAATIFSMVKKPHRAAAAQKVWRRIFLREWREYRGLSGKRLADLSGVSEGQINLIENRKSAGSPDTLEKLAKALDCEIGELLDIKPGPEGRMFRLWVREADLPRIEAIADALNKVPE